MNHTVTLDEIKKKHLNLVGNKAFRLGQLAKFNLNVPQAFVITTEAFDKFSNFKDFPNKLQREVSQHLKSFSQKKFSVRSSATCEDSPKASFAGQFKTVLSVKKQYLPQAIRKVWQSAFSKNLTVYLKNNHLRKRRIKMAVIVQEMIWAEKGGVIFTQNPFGNQNTMIIETCSGLGEKVVSGLEDPERIIVHKKTLKVLRKSSPQGPVLTSKEIRSLAKTALEIEKLYQRPQDIEWAIKDNLGYILQARPITI